jgi:hypothetical protein
MYIQPGQLKDVQKEFPEVKKEDCSVVAEFGNDRGMSFSGTFMVNIKKRGIYRFEDGKLVLRVKGYDKKYDTNLE